MRAEDVHPADLPPACAPLRPLTRLENAFWILDRLSPESGVSNIELAFRVARPPRWWPLHTAANVLLRRHPALRMRFPEAGGVPVRHLTAPENAMIEVRSHAVAAGSLERAIQRFARRPFDLARDFPFRVGAFRTPAGEHAICIVLHHIAGDVVSCRLLVEELCRIYDAAAGDGGVPAEFDGEVPMLAPKDPSARALRYWKERLAGADPDGMRLDCARPRDAAPTFAGRTLRRTLSDEARDAMRRLGAALRATDNIVLLAAFNLALLRHGAGPDLVVGVPVRTRRPAQAAQVGLGISTLALRVRADPGAGFDDLVRRTRDAFLEGAEHAEASVEAVLTELGRRSEDWSTPLFRHMFNYRAWDVDHVALGGEPVRFVELDDRSRLDLELAAVPGPHGVLLRATYATDVHHEADVAALMERMDVLLCDAARDPRRPLRELGVTTAADRELLRAVNAVEKTWEGPATVLERVAARAREAPDATAVVDRDRTVAYGELLAWADAVRSRLRACGVRRGDVVGLAMGRSAAMAAAILGTGWSGAGFLPLSTGNPDDRLGFQVGDADVALVLVPEGTEAPAWAGDRAVAGMPPQPARSGDVPVPAAGAVAGEDLVYVMYTSGSSGRPKGVRVSHGNLNNLVLSIADLLGADADTSALWSTTPAFDISMLELFLPLCTGARVVVAGDEAQLDPRAFLDLVETGDVAVVQATPTAWRLIAAQAGGELDGRCLLSGGEPLPADLAVRLRALAARVLNVYGPTETTIWSTAADLGPPSRGPLADPVPIGRPLANTRVFITDRFGQEAPPGVVGELCIAGDGVSLGYLGRPELNADRFGDHPDLGTFYRTGDLARLRPDGALETLGRGDRQLKLRGHRIEPGEIEAVLNEDPATRAAAVTVSGDPQTEDGMLVAFVSVSGDEDDVAARLWELMLRRLPHYAVPGRVHLVETLPVTPSGKVDHRALAELTTKPAAPHPRSDDRAEPADEGLTGKLVELWRQILGRPRLGPHDNFFLNGGHSLYAVRMSARLEEILGLQVSPQAVFGHPTAAGLARYLTEMSRR